MKFAFVVLAILFFALGANGQTPHLSWVASSTSGVTGYNVYRAFCTGTITAGACSSAGSFVRVNNQAVTGTTFVDTTAIVGLPYDYYVTAVCPSACSPTESVPSNHYAIQIPKQALPPEPPTGLTITNVT